MKTTIIVQNLKCGGCSNTISTNLSALQNISDVEVDVAESAISFQFINAQDAIKVKEKLKALGYPTIEDSNSFSSKTKSFISCAIGKL